MSQVLRLLWPYALSALLGFSGAWYARGLQVTAAEQEFAQFKLDATEAAQRQKAQQDKITQETNDAIPKYVAALHDYYRRNPVVRMLPPAKRDPGADAGDPGGAERGSADVVLAAADWARIDHALKQCGETTLMFVELRNTWRRHLGE